ATMASRGCARITARPTTRRSCSIRTATTSRPSAPLFEQPIGFTHLELDRVAEPVLARLRHRFGASARTELAEQRFDVELHGVRRDVEATRDNIFGEVVTIHNLPL